MGTELTDAGTGASVTNFEVQIRSTEICCLWNLDYYFRLHRSRGHYLDVFRTPTTNDDGSPREIDDFLPRERFKKLLATGNLHSSDQPKMRELGKESCVQEDLLKESVKHRL